ncbi:acyl-CoA N-acyltransferase [Choiromyces venosus 120613-1]|uniref:Acyl-CoA N-acyltransferase n=1 Tax=Choiromyces venosus 120613-1 TaxID=1336337 RepID=A0A3N4JUI4_9PEZI|nr:acyl-CoA N-acyltransferase [Choiromyces venosus 120613-1]
MGFSDLKRTRSATERFTKERVYVRTLTLSDLEACAALEEAAFIPSERCPRETFSYRLKVCPELCFGIFTIRRNKEYLLGHAIATKTLSPSVTESSMAIATPRYSPHHPAGPTIALHSLAIQPAHQGRYLGTTLLQEYIQRMSIGGGCEQRIALIARDRLVGFYERFGFRCKGVSPVKFGGGEWMDLVLEI